MVIRRSLPKLPKMHVSCTKRVLGPVTINRSRMEYFLNIPCNLPGKTLPSFFQRNLIIYGDPNAMTSLSSQDYFKVMITMNVGGVQCLPVELRGSENHIQTWKISLPTDFR
ncbi:hypothetical protein Y1Q_0002317 [Alligator mississippiensis]|uniref:Uncharacterized protein n=1 Tax=Alligator mississippiensis TaxID=8496 RepID=A0A151MGR0_ALLMI|nr:hypothetical protein Y1Q_0002317 [Alligator mississippiensis]